MLISVTQGHIDKARRLLNEDFAVRCQCCPVVLALREVTDKDWSVLGRTASLPTGRWTALSRRCCRWIARFDSRADVSPFTFRFIEGVQNAR